MVVGVPFDHRRQPYHRTFLEINWRIHPDLVTSTKIPAADKLVWFSPELRQDIAPLTPYPDGVIRIAFRGVELVLTRHGDDYDVERIK